MAKLVVLNDDGTQRIIRENVSDGIVAVKIFSLEDIQDVLSDSGFEGTAKEAAAVADGTGLERSLSSADETDWEKIACAVGNAETAGVIVREN